MDKGPLAYGNLMPSMLSYHAGVVFIRTKMLAQHRGMKDGAEKFTTISLIMSGHAWRLAKV